MLRARLSDAQFFWDQDRKAPLASRVPALDGWSSTPASARSATRSRRLEALAAWLAQRVPGADASRRARAAQLCKADLVTGMVGEFPELQGIMGALLRAA